MGFYPSLCLNRPMNEHKVSNLKLNKTRSAQSKDKQVLSESSRSNEKIKIVRLRISGANATESVVGTHWDTKHIILITESDKNAMKEVLESVKDSRKQMSKNQTAIDKLKRNTRTILHTLTK
jgi:hypothetical protein